MTALDGVPASAKLHLKFTYDWMGRRVQKQVFGWNASATTYNTAPTSTTRFLYDGWNLVAEMDGNNGNAGLRSYFWGLDLSGTLRGAGGVGGLLSVTDYTTSANGEYFACYDGNGNVTGLVNSTDGGVSATYAYGPFGEAIEAAGSSIAQSNPIRWSSKYFDGETEESYYGYRYYNRGLARWLSRDPLQEAAGVNRYSFVANCPTCRIDIDGRQAQSNAELPYGDVKIGGHTDFSASFFDSHDCMFFNQLGTYGNRAAFLAGYSDRLLGEWDGGPTGTGFNMASAEMAHNLAFGIVQLSLLISEERDGYDGDVSLDFYLERLTQTLYQWSVGVTVLAPVERWCPDQVPHPKHFAYVSSHKGERRKFVFAETVPNP